MSSLGIGTDVDEAAHVRRGRRAALAALLVIAAITVGVVGGGYLLVQRLFAGPEDYPGPGSGEVLVEVETGDSATAIGRTLEEHGVVASVAAFRDLASEDARAGSIQPGFYAMRQQMSAAGALELLLDPEARMESEVTVPEGLRLDRTVETLAEGTDIPREDFAAALEDPGQLGLPGWAGGNPEGLLFPATYTVGPGATAAEVLEMMVRRFQQAADETNLEEGAGRLSPRQLLVIASLIEAEAPPEAMGRVSRVIHNRLAEGMPLQMDSTVNYATGKTGITTTARDRAHPSPYNTYARTGLPPGPINSPSQAAIEAAMVPEEGAWLYFVTVNPDTGETRFARTGEGHRENVEVFQQWLRRQDGRGSAG